MVASVLSSILHRTGVVRALTALWRRDIKAGEADSAARHEEIARALKELAREQKTLTKQGSHAAAAIEQLTNQVAELTRISHRLEGQAEALEQVIASNRSDGPRLQVFRRAIDEGAVARHIASAIAAAPLVDDPAPMLIVERLFPDDIFETFLAAIPPGAAFDVKDRTKADYRASRPEAAVPDLAQAVWPSLTDDLIPRAMVPAIAARFAPFIASYYRDLLGSELGSEVSALPLEATEARLMLRRPGYHLDPHLDPKRVLMTSLLYFARPGDDEAHGTSFYRIDGKVVRDHATTYYPVAAGHRCELARVVPFRPNTAVVFLNSAAHGADLPATLPKRLERYALQFYIGPSVDALQGILRRLPDVEQRAWAGRGDR
jgi:hypothetical protein